MVIFNCFRHTLNPSSWTAHVHGLPHLPLGTCRTLEFHRAGVRRFGTTTARHTSTFVRFCEVLLSRFPPEEDTAMSFPTIDRPLRGASTALQSQIVPGITVAELY